MRSCQACQREFCGRSPVCPHCLFNNSAKGGPRSAGAMAEVERERLEEEQFERDLAELGDEFAILLERTGTADEPDAFSVQRTPDTPNLAKEAS